MTRALGALLLCSFVGAPSASCTARTPRDIDDCCAIFEEKRAWYRASRKSYDRWGTPIPVQLAIIHQESGFRARANPPRTRILWIFPGPRPSTAYGYTQALHTTWKEYVDASGNRGADRHKFHDATDFVGWYTARSARKTGVSQHDAYSLYLAYHEGDGGFQRRTYRGKQWLVDAAARVRTRAARYQRQLAGCEHRFRRRWWLLWLF